MTGTLKAGDWEEFGEAGVCLFWERLPDGQKAPEAGHEKKDEHRNP